MASPTDIILSANTIAENSATGTTIGTLTATDPDVGNTFTFSLVDNAGGRFQISGTSLQVANGLLIDYEENATHSYNVIVRVTDNTGATYQETIAIQVTNVNPESLTGTSSADTLRGGAGNDTINGGAGADSMVGGGGNDLFYVDNAGDVIEEAILQGGVDTASSSVTYTLGANVENLTLTGVSAINGTGNSGNNTLTGNSAANTLDGGLGNDTMLGGAGDDIYYVDDADDVVTENASEGTDRVMAAISYTMGANVENLTLTGTGGISATGNTLANSITGNSGSNTIDGGTGNDTMAGGLGNDTYVVDAAGDVVTENASEGTDTVQSAITYTLGSNVENLVLTGTSAVNGTGNTLANSLTGNSAANTLSGGTGADTMSGGDGNDTYVVDNTGDVVTESSTTGGTDAVQSSVTYTLGTNVENLTLTGTGAINGTGNALANSLTGNTGNNVLDGGAGADTMTGGTGDDTYVVDNAGDSVVEAATSGTDTVQSSVTYTLGTDVENLTLTGTGAINGTGNTVANVINGNTGANVIDGGAGADTMNGGLGDDTYTVDNAGDTISEAPTGGTDSVNSSVTYTLSDFVENLTLTGTSAINGTGNASNNSITGNSGANTIDGGTGADTMAGGGGNDIYVVDHTGDVVTEAALGGTDTVQASSTYTLGTEVENLTLTGLANVDGTGNSLGNSITGNAGHNILNGGTGTDTLAGGLGNDTYVTDGGDTITENADEGTDTVQSSATYTLGSNIENLTLTGTSAINGTGNTLDNVITGNSGNNTLSGGTGADTLIGGGGNDTYVVDNAGDVVMDGGGSSGLIAAGTDTVQASVTVTLGTDIENVTLTGTSAISATGNALANSMTGNSGANWLTGGAGADTMAGGAGNDTYVVDNVGDVVTEAAASGTDTVRSSITYTLGAEVENLILTGSAAINGTGNTLANSITGNGAANVIDGGTGADTMAGGGGNDTYYVDNAGDVVTELTSGGTDTVSTALTHSLAVNVENLILTGTSAVNGTGNAAANSITGNSGNNVLDGGLGIDTMIGGAGDDTYVVDHTSDVVTEGASAGTDTVQSSANFTLSDNVENLTLTGTAAIDGTGNALGNVITGNAGNNTLDGAAGVDTMSGGLGNDVYIVDSTSDSVTENASEGTDQVRSTVTWTLGSNFENLLLLGTSSINGTGNTLANLLVGNTGANTLNGGTGADTMKGGAGNDTYVVDDVGDVVTEYTGNGTDTVQSSITHTLALNVENLTLTGSSAINGTGNALANSLTGNTGNNTLNGGTGADTMAGGTGDDTYVVDNAGDVVTEAATSGTDTVQSSIAYTLGSEVENLTLTGSAAINATGNAVANVINGNNGANLIDGGVGADTMAGGLGNDTYVVDDAGDVVTETVTGGTDTVQTALTYTLGSNLENLTLTGSSAVNGTGNALGNVLTGNSAANTLTAGGGNDTLNGGGGNDTLLGGVGDDVFIFNTALNATTNVDTITGFSVVDDLIHLDDAVMSALTVGALDATAFVVGAAATTTAQRIIYNDTTGALSYDADGSGAGAAVQFATLATGLVLTEAHFLVI